MKRHELKIDSILYKAIRNGSMTAIMRKIDQNHQVGDVLIFSPIDRFTGAPISPDFCCREVTHRLNGEQYGIENGYCLLSLSDK